MVMAPANPRLSECSEHGHLNCQECHPLETRAPWQIPGPNFIAENNTPPLG